MSSRIKISILMFGLVSIAGFTPLTAEGTATGEPSLEALSWLAGCWENLPGERVSEECWMAPRGGVILGLNRSLGRGGKASFEFLRIALEESGAIVYHASPGGRPSTPFRLVESTADTAVFENPEHDFPQRITYRLAEDGLLRVRVEAEKEGKMQGFELVWQRRSGFD